MSKNSFNYIFAVSVYVLFSFGNANSEPIRQTYSMGPPWH